MIEAAFHWLGQTPVGTVMRDSTWGFAVVETVHLLALAALGGAVLVVDLTAGGVLFRRSDGASVIRAAKPAFISSLAVMLVSGTLLVASKPVRYYLDDIFRAKMLLLALAIIGSLVVQHVAARPSRPSISVRVVAPLSLLLWLAVGICGRLIGFA